MALIVVGLVMMSFISVGAVLLLPGLVLCVCSAALVASKPSRLEASGGSSGVPAARSESTVTVWTLAGLTLVPFGVVGALILLGADPLAIYLVGYGVFALAGFLALVFVVVFFAGRWTRGRSVN